MNGINSIGIRTRLSNFSFRVAIHCTSYHITYIRHAYPQNKVSRETNKNDLSAEVLLVRQCVKRAVKEHEIIFDRHLYREKPRWRHLRRWWDSGEARSQNWQWNRSNTRNIWRRWTQTSTGSKMARIEETCEQPAKDDDDDYYRHQRNWSITT